MKYPLLILFLCVLGCTAPVPQSQQRTSTTEPIEARPKLALISLTSTANEYGYATVEGQVKNFSKTDIDFAKVIVTITSDKGDFIKTDDSFLDYNHLSPDQISPFKVMMADMPDKWRYSVEFLDRDNTKIETIDIRKKK